MTDIHSRTYRSSCAAAWARVPVCVCTGTCVCVRLYVCMCLVSPTSAFFSTLFLVIWFERLSGWTCRGKHFYNSSGGAHTHARTHTPWWDSQYSTAEKWSLCARAHTRSHALTRRHTVKALHTCSPLLSAVFRLMNANDLKILIHVCTTQLLWQIWKSSLMDAH